MQYPGVRFVEPMDRRVLDGLKASIIRELHYAQTGEETDPARISVEARRAAGWPPSSLPYQSSLPLCDHLPVYRVTGELADDSGRDVIARMLRNEGLAYVMTLQTDDETLCWYWTARETAERPVLVDDFCTPRDADANVTHPDLAAIALAAWGLAPP